MIALIDVNGQKMPLDDNGNSLFAAKIDVHKNVAEITVRIPTCLEGDDMDCANVKYEGTGLVKTSLNTLLNDFIEVQDDVEDFKKLRDTFLTYASRLDQEIKHEEMQ